MLTKIYKFLPRAIVAFILLQTLVFKFGIGGPEYLNESQMLFTALAENAFGNPVLEAFLRIGTGILELIASILILLPRTALYGAAMSMGLMFGAILSHLLFIGISINDDGGQLMVLAFVVLFCSLWVIWQERENFPFK